MRTAPFPNIPAIPGMNPGIWIMAAGGGIGGARGGDGDAGEGTQGAGGEGGGDDAGGDGRCAGSGGMGCPVHSQSPSAGDPVELSTGRVFSNPVIDLKLGGPLPFVWERSYSSASWALDLGLGHGWSHSFAWYLHLGRRAAAVMSARGEVVGFPLPPKDGSTVESAEGWQLFRDEDGFILDATDGVLRRFRPTSEPNDFRLVEVFDRNRNVIRLEYDGHLLTRATDCVGRHVAIRRDATGRISSLEVYNAVSQGRWVAFVHYHYDQNGDLVHAVDADGYGARFRYDAHRMTEFEGAEGLVFHYRYDPRGRCIETWGDYPGRADESLADGVPETLADGVTPARGVHHVRLTYGPDGYVEVVDSRQVQRLVSAPGHGKAEKTVSGGGVTTRSFNEFGSLREMTDPLGGTTTYERDARGRVLSETDPLGRTTRFSRDERGLVIEETLPDGTSYAYEYDERGNVISIVDPRGGRTECARDARGLATEVVQPSGASTRYQYDTMGNISARVEPNGATTTIEYDFFGRPTALRGPLGATVHAMYSTAGRCIGLRDADGATTQYVRDGEGRVVTLVDAMGRSIRYRYAGYDRLVAIEHPDGAATRYTYDREGRMVEVWNERSERYRAGVGLTGLLREEAFFDGRALRYRRDAMGRVIEIRTDSGEVTKLEYDAAGQLVGKTLPDGTVHAFEWDACGRPIAMRSPVGEFLLERDATGNIVREVQIVDGRTFEVRHEVDRGGRRTELAGSFGFLAKIERDAAGQPVRISTEDGGEISYQRDAAGEEIARIFAGGGRLELEFDVVGNLSQLRTRSAKGATVERRFAYNAMSELVSVWDTLKKSSIEYGYDARHRLTSHAVDGKTRDHFDYDGAGNVFLRGKQTRYGAGNRLEMRDTDTYAYDALGRLVEKRRSVPTGVERTLYHWSADGRLERVETPDGGVTSFAYDPLGRRVLKRVERAVDGGLEQALTRFVWDGDRLVHEICRRSKAGGDPVVEERTYGFSEKALVPWGMRVRRQGGGADEEGAWSYYVLDQAGMPVALVDEAGEVLCEYERSTWGELVPRPGARVDSPIRAQGQYADPEIGLHYNRNRYYDPEAGRYISPDPLGIVPDLNEYRYGDNPITDVDPFGLAPHSATATHSNRPLQNSQTGGYEFLSGWSGRKYDNYDQYIQDIRAEGATFGTCYRECHSEFKIMRELAGGDGSVVNPRLRNSTTRIHGQSRSCPNCAAALEDFAQRNQMRIEYTSDEDDDALVVDFRPNRNSSNRTSYSSTTVAGYGK